MAATLHSKSYMPLLRSPLVAGLALTAAVSLLWAFGHLVQQGVNVASERRVEAHVQATAVWQCAWSKGVEARASCQNAWRSQRIASLQTLS